METSSIKIKLEGFKTYKETSVLGPFRGLIGIFGRNGSGKTNILDGLDFLFENSSKNNQKNFPNLIFTKIIPDKEHSYVKIGLYFKKKSFVYDFVKITNYSNVTDYFLNNKKISFKKFLVEAFRLKFDKFKKISKIFRNKNHDIFFKSNFVYNLIQGFSSSKELIDGIIKASLTQQKLQENYYFYSKKLKFTLEEKRSLLMSSKKLINIDLKKFFFIKKKNIRDFYKIHWCINKVWKILDKLKKKSKKIREYFLNKKNLDELFKSKKNLSKINKPVQKTYFLFQIEKTLKFNLWLINTNNKNTFSVLNKINHSFRLRNKNLNYQEPTKSFKFDKKKYLSFRTNSKLIHCLFYKSSLKKHKLKKTTFGKKGFCFYIKFFMVFIENVKKIHLTIKKRIIVRTFFSTISLIFLLSSYKKKKSFNVIGIENKEKNLKQLINFNQAKIRGSIGEILKPLDSKYRTLIQDNFIFEKPFILVDTLDTVNKFLKILEKNKNSIVSFYPIKSGHKNKQKEKNCIINKFLIDFDFDEYDSYISNLIFKNLSNQYLNLNEFTFENLLQDFSFDKKQTKPKFGFFIETKSTNDSGLKNILSAFKLKKILKNSFNLVSEKILDISIMRKKIDKKIFFYKTFIKFVKIFDFDKITNTSKIKNNSINVSNKNIYFFKNKMIFFLNLYDFLKLKKKINKKIINNDPKLKFEKKIIFFKITEIFKNFFKTNSLKSNKNFVQDFFSIPIKNFYSYFFHLKKNLNSRLKNNSIRLEYSLFYFFNMILFKLKELGINKSSRLNFNLEKNPFHPNKISQIKTEIKLKNNIIKKAENIIKITLTKNSNFGVFFIGNDSRAIRPIFQEKPMSNLIDITIIFVTLNFEPKNFLNKKNWLLKKIFKKKTTISFGKKLLINNQLDFLEKRFKELREKMIKNRKNYFIIFHKKKKMIFSKEKKFLNYFEDWSRLVRIIYKNISATYLNPFGGTIFLDYVSDQIHRKNRIIFSIVPNQRILKHNEHLSEGERTLVVLSIFISFNYLNSPPLMILDEIDSHLDQLNLKKFIELFKKLEKKKGWSIIIISQRNSLSFYFSGFVGIYKSIKGSKIHLIKF